MLTLQPTPRLQGHELSDDRSREGPTAAGEALQGRIFNLRFRGGVRQRVLYLSPAKPVAAIVMLPGGAGNIGLKADGDIRHGDNFVVRTAATGRGTDMP